MGVAIDKSALAFNTQQPYFLFTVIASFSIDLFWCLLLFGGLLFGKLCFLLYVRNDFGLGVNALLSQGIDVLGFFGH